MSYADDLFAYSMHLLGDLHSHDGATDAYSRRLVSTVYYALFHRLTEDATVKLAPNVTETTKRRIQRWFDHAEMKRVCTRFFGATLEGALRQMIGDTAPSELRLVCLAFVQLQEARHRADYDMSFALTKQDATDYLNSAFDADRAWQRIKHTPEANIFILSLLMWKNWDRERH